MSKQNTSQEKPILNINLRVFVYFGLIFLLFYPPFLRGLFFPPELLMTHMFTAVLFALCWYDKILRRDVTFLKGPLDYLTLAFVFVYVLSLFGAVNMRGAVGELLKVINYFMVYWITKETVKSEKDIKVLFRVIFFSAVGVAVVGLGAAMGVIGYPGAVVGTRIYSTLQYPNTTAAFLALATFLGLYLLNSGNNRISKMIYITGNMLLMTVIVASQSRGSWFLYPLIIVLYFIGLPKTERFSTFYNLVLTLGVGLQVARVLQSRMLSGTGLAVWHYLVIGTVVTVLLQWVYDFVIAWFDERQISEKNRKLFGAGVVVYALVVGCFYIIYTSQAVPSVAAQFAPTEALQRASSVNNQDASIMARLDLSKASFKMALDYPLNGLGGGGWDALYHRYMPFLTYSSETHNYPAKVLVETGFLGLFVLLGIWIAWGKNIYSLWQDAEDEHKSLICAVGAATLMLIIHSIYDFDLSMGAMGIVLWCLWGITAGAYKMKMAGEKRIINSNGKMILAAAVGTLIAAVIFLPALSFYSAGTAGADGAKAMTGKNWNEAEKQLLRATKLDPFTASYSADLAQIYYIDGMANNNPAFFTLAEKYALQATKVEPYNYHVRLRLLIASLLSGQVELAVNNAESLVANNPLDVHNFEILGKIYVSAGRYLYEADKKDKARNYWRKATQMNVILNKQIQESKYDPAKSQGDPLQITPVINLYEGEASYLLGDYSKATSFLREASKNIDKLPEQLNVELQLYLNAVKAKLGNKSNAQQEINKLAKTFPGLPGEFNTLLQIKP